MNYAFIGRQFDYHSPSSTPEVLDQGALQHMGAEVLRPRRRWRPDPCPGARPTWPTAI